jgi:hypothetical protein
VIPRLWPGETFICLASGPSLTAEDVNACRGHGRIIAVNDTIRLAPFADVLYACDGRWWDYHRGVPSFSGLKYGLSVKVGKWSGVVRLSNTGVQGFEPGSHGVRTGGNSGYQAIQVAAHLGAARILLLGYDMKVGAKGRTHFFGEHPAIIRSGSNYGTLCAYYRSLAKPLAALGIPVVNCSRETALTCFPRMTLSQALHVAA